MVVCVSAEDVVKWRRAHPEKLTSLPVYQEISKNYSPSLKISRSVSHKRKGANQQHTLNPTLGIVLKDDSVTQRDVTLKSIIMALNKMSASNVNGVFKELNAISIRDPEELRRIASLFLRKAMNEAGFRSHYMDVVERLSWTCVQDEYEFSFRFMFLIEAQRTFEDIASLSKDEGARLMETLAGVYMKSWLAREVFEKIVKKLLGQPGMTNVEHVIAFLKACPAYHDKTSLINTIGKLPSLPLRLRMILENIETPP